MTRAPSALIAEDEPVLADALARQLHKLWPPLQVISMASDGPQTYQQALSHLPDILFLDIHMPGASGLEVAETLVEDWPAERALPLIVFITAYDDYAVAAFERAAIDYVLKPVRPERLALTCQRLQAQLSLQGEGAAPAGSTLPSGLLALRPPPAAQPLVPPLKVVQAAAGSSVYLIPIEDVLYFEAADKYVRIICQGDQPGQPDKLIRTPLRELLPRLDADLFWQIHRGHVVNVRAIERVSRQLHRVRVHLRGRTDTLDVSRMYMHLFKAM